MSNDPTWTRTSHIDYMQYVATVEGRALVVRAWRAGPRSERITATVDGVHRHARLNGVRRAQRMLIGDVQRAARALRVAE